MPDAELSELERRIAIARENLRELVEQAATLSGASDEDRAAARIEQQSAALDALIKQRDELTKKT
jgi:hypothetical protein